MLSNSQRGGDGVHKGHWLRRRAVCQQYRLHPTRLWDAWTQASTEVTRLSWQFDGNKNTCVVVMQERAVINALTRYTKRRPQTLTVQLQELLAVAHRWRHPHVQACPGRMQSGQLPKNSYSLCAAFVQRVCITQQETQAPSQPVQTNHVIITKRLAFSHEPPLPKLHRPVLHT